jgi:hypothetical protein
MKEKPYKVGDKVRAKIAGLAVDATIRAIVEQTDGVHYQVDFGHEQTALIHERQVVESIR